MALGTTWGLIFAIISMICNGSFSSLNKLPKVQASNVNPQIFNLYFINGVFISSIAVYIILLLMGETVEFTYLGVISGFCLSVCGVTTFAAIKYIGLSVGVTIWSGTAILVSFAQGFIAGTKAETLWIAIIGCIILLIGIIGVGFSDQFVQIYCKHYDKTDHYIYENMDTIYNIQNTASNISNTETVSQYRNLLFGILFAVMTGIFGGSVGFPSNWCNDNNSKLKYLLSFAVGLIFYLPIIIFWILFVSSSKIEWHSRTCLVPGLFAGLIWNIGNVASLYAIESLSYGVAYPIMQSSLIVANLWGIFVWKECIDKRVICLLFFFCFIVMIGCGFITVGVIQL